MAGRRKRQKNCPAAKGQDRPVRASPPYVMTACAPFYIPRGETPLRGAQKGRFFLYMVLLYPINAFCNSAGWKNYQNFKYPAKFCQPSGHYVAAQATPFFVACSAGEGLPRSRRHKLHIACFALWGKRALIPLCLLSKTQTLRSVCVFVSACYAHTWLQIWP